MRTSEAAKLGMVLRQVAQEIEALSTPTLPPNAGKPWSDEEDGQLIAWGLAVGHDFVAEHDLGRSRQEGLDRIAWLRKHKPSLVRHIEVETKSYHVWSEPLDMRRKENRRKIH